MNNFRKIICIVLFLSLWGLAACSNNSPGPHEEKAASESGRAESKSSLDDCGELLHFRLIGLKDLYRADICLENGGIVKGYFYIFAEYSDSPTTTAAFEGRLERKRLEVQFASGKAPYPTSPDTASSEEGRVVWRLDEEPPASRKLTFKTYGKDYDRNTWRSYSADMERARLVTGKSLQKISSNDLEAIAAP